MADLQPMSMMRPKHSSRSGGLRLSVVGAIRIQEIIDTLVWWPSDNECCDTEEVLVGFLRCGVKKVGAPKWSCLPRQVLIRQSLDVHVTDR